MANQGDGKIYYFGRFSLDVVERRLLHDGAEIRLTPRLTDLLLMLLESEGRLLLKEEMMSEVWRGEIVEENNLTVSISTLRKALGEKRGERRFIETVARRGYRFVARVSAAGPPDAPQLSPRIGQVTPADAAAAGSRLAVAVLPITLADAGRELDYVCDGITGGLIDALSHSPHLRVMARSTVFSFKSKEVSPLEVGRVLGVSAVVVGSLSARPGGLSLSVELVDVADGTRRWGADYERPLASIVTLHEEAARQIEAELGPSRETARRGPAPRAAEQNSEPYLLSLKGRYCWSKHGEYWIRKGIRYFEKALRISPTYAPAHAGLADSYQRLSSIYMPPAAAWPKVMESAAKALELDPSLAEAHLSLGMASLYFQHDWAAAEREFTLAIEINPGSGLARRRYGGFLSLMGRFDESVEETKLALELDPLSFQTAVNLGATYLWAERIDDAIEMLRQTLELSPDFQPAHIGLGCAYREAGDFESAIREFHELASLMGKPAVALGFLGHSYARSGARREARRVLTKLMGLQDRWATKFSLALVHAALGESDEALSYLESLYEERNDWLMMLNVGAEFNGLRDDPRFISLLSRIGFQKPGSVGILTAPRGL